MFRRFCFIGHQMLYETSNDSACASGMIINILVAFTGSEFTLLNFPKGTLFNRVNRSGLSFFEPLNSEPVDGYEKYMRGEDV